MREFTFTAILKSVLRVFEVATAVFTQRIERAVAEKAVEIIRVIGLMTRKEFTVLM